MAGRFFRLSVRNTMAGAEERGITDRGDSPEERKHAPDKLLVRRETIRRCHGERGYIRGRLRYATDTDVDADARGIHLRALAARQFFGKLSFSPTVRLNVFGSLESGT